MIRECVGGWVISDAIAYENLVGWCDWLCASKMGSSTRGRPSRSRYDGKVRPRV